MDASAQEWVAETLAQHGLSPTGPLEVVKRRPWATVLRAPTSSGVVYFKANAPGGRHEPALARELARAWPDRVPAPLAADPERGWMLTLDHGRRLADVVPGDRLLATWEELLPRYAEIQLAAVETPERWLALGVPDRRLERLPAAAEALVRGSADLADDERARMLALLPELEAVCGELASLPAAASLEHGDLHGNNVLVGRGAHWFFDWADSSVSHPFFSLLIAPARVFATPTWSRGRPSRPPASCFVSSRSRCGWRTSGVLSIGSTCSPEAMHWGGTSGTGTSPPGCGTGSRVGAGRACHPSARAPEPNPERPVPRDQPPILRPRSVSLSSSSGTRS
jgi:hypothetical protein